jgi:hypothetical protein
MGREFVSKFSVIPNRRKRFRGTHEHWAVLAPFFPALLNEGLLGGERLPFLKGP